MSRLFAGDARDRGSRAYVRVDRGQARVGNAWIERTWSSFMGHTTGLVQKSTGTEWVSARNPEFSVEANGEVLGVEDFGEVAWSETHNALGAVLVAAQVRPGLELTIRTTALHEAPGLLRSVWIMNTSPDRVTVGPIVTESFALEREGAQFYVRELRRAHDAIEVGQADALAAIVAGGEGLFIGHEGASTLDLASSEPGVCSARVLERRTLGPAERWMLDPTFLVPFTGDLHAAADTLIPDLQRRVRRHEALEKAHAEEIE